MLLLKQQKGFDSFKAFLIVVKLMITGHPLNS
jgi:hypothetical protein